MRKTEGGRERERGAWNKTKEEGVSGQQKTIQNSKTDRHTKLTVQRTDNKTTT